MKVCPNCQTAVNDTDKFCRKCGYNIENGANSSVTKVGRYAYEVCSSLTIRAPKLLAKQIMQSNGYKKLVKY